MAKNLRAIDQKIFSEKNRKDFKNRNHGLSNKRIFELILALLAVILGTMILVYLQTMIGGLVCAGAGFVLLLFALQTERYKEIIERSEFLNALLASAAGEGHKFTAIATKKNGQIVYLNEGFQKTFPKMVDMERRSLGKLFTTYKVDKTKSKPILEAIKKSSKKTTTIEIKNGKKTQKIKISVEPIKRPEGFVLVRGA